MKLFRTSSLSLNVRPSFFILSFLLAIFLGATVTATFLIMGLLFLVFFFHELGHVLVARLLGRPCDTVIGWAGGKTEVYGPVLKFWKRIAIQVGGIVATYLMLMASGVWIFDDEMDSTPVHKWVALFYILNVGWFWFNVLPLYPFDGGEIILDIGGSLFGRLGQKAAAVVSMAASAFFAVYLLAEGVLIGVLFGFYCLMQSFLLFRHPALSFRGELSEEALRVHELRQRWVAGEQEQVLEQMQKIANESTEKEVRQEAVECASSYLLASDRPRETYELLSHAKDPLIQPALEHLQLAAYKTSHWQEGLAAGREAFRETQSIPVATMCALLAARLGLAEEACGWLLAARRLGLEDLATIIAADDFDSIRETPEFQKLIPRK